MQQSAYSRENQLTMSILRDYRGGISPETLAKEFAVYLAARNLPPVPLSFRFLSMREQREALQNHHIDFSFSLGFDYDNLRFVQAEVLARRKIYVLLPASHPLADKKEVSLKELSEETFLVLSPSESFTANNITVTMLHNFFKQPKTRIVTNLQSMAFDLANGDYVTLGNLRFLSDSAAENFVEIPITELKNAGYEETLAYNAGDMPKKKELFLDFVRQYSVGI